MKLIEDFIIFRENPNERKNVNEYFIMKPEPDRFIPAKYIFSYWIFIWAVIYIAVKYLYLFLGKAFSSHFLENHLWLNPSLVLSVAFIWTTESLIKLLMNGALPNVLLKQIMIIICIKAIPLYLVWTNKINLYRDVSITIILFAIYCLYLWWNNTDVFSVYQDLMESVENDENRTPLEYWFNKIFGI